MPCKKMEMQFIYFHHLLINDQDIFTIIWNVMGYLYYAHAYEATT